MAGCGSVQRKISCVFNTVVLKEDSTKRARQSYRVVAGEVVRETALSADVFTCGIPTEKIDGTCVYVQNFHGQPWLWARHDRKPNKVADKKFKKYQNAKQVWELNGREEGKEPKPFHWNVEKDFKDVPSDWMPADQVEVENDTLKPDASGHILGWVPVDPKARQHCWHATCIDFDKGSALILQPWHSSGSEETDSLELVIQIEPLRDLLGYTFELIGTNINGNPYRLGSKQTPLHMLVQHGSIPFLRKPPINCVDLKKWLLADPEGKVEGIVWHCPNCTLFKVHRHHLEYSWPIQDTRLTTLPVTIKVDLSDDQSLGHNSREDKSLFTLFHELNGRTYPSITMIKYEETLCNISIE